MNLADRLNLIADTLDAATERLESAGAVKAWKAAKPAVPSSDAILARALDSLGLTDAYHAGTLTGRQPLDVLHAVRLEGRRWLRAAAETLLEDVAPDDTKALFGRVKAKVEAFFRVMKRYIKELLTAGVMVIAGPDPAILQLPVIEDALKQGYSIQVEYLDDFRRRVVTEQKPLDGSVAANAEMFGSSVWDTTQAVQRDVAKKTNIFNFERREHFGINPNDLCKVCAAEIKKGVVPVGTLRSVGDSPCRQNCHCAFVYYEYIGGPEHNTIFAGRGPMDFAVFGRTG